jgi:hypothetical protein
MWKVLHAVWSPRATYPLKVGLVSVALRQRQSPNRYELIPYSYGTSPERPHCIQSLCHLQFLCGASYSTGRLPAVVKPSYSAFTSLAGGHATIWRGWSACLSRMSLLLLMVLLLATVQPDVVYWVRRCLRVSGLSSICLG